MFNLISAFVFAGLAFASTPDCSRQAGSLPRVARAAGRPDAANPVEHVLVIMQENHSFDNYFGALSSPRHYGKEVDGIRRGLSNPDNGFGSIPVFKQKELCVKDPSHSWNDMHRDWDGGRNDGFVNTGKNGPRVMGYYDETDLPFYYALADQFAISDRHFASVMTQTFPNRFYLLAATSFGQVKNLDPVSKSSYAQKTIFDLLDQYGISWAYYDDGTGYLKFFQPLYLRSLAKLKTIADYESDLKTGNLPQVAFLDTSAEGEDEHPDADIQRGEAWVGERVRALIASPYWRTSALFFTYDEGGGFFDHVPPPAACAPDAIAPKLDDGAERGDFARYGFRVPFVAVSPFAKRHYVSHMVQDHTSILKFIESKWNLPALTARDANASDLHDLFDFQHPDFNVKPLPETVPDPTRSCSPPPGLSLPTVATSIVSKKSGKCLAVRNGETTFETCDDSPEEKWVFPGDAFHRRHLENPASNLCLTADYEAGAVRAVPCEREEDQGFSFVPGNSEHTVEFPGWAKGECLTSGRVGEPATLSTCYTGESIIDFTLE
jgi:phospholipase C